MSKLICKYGDVQVVLNGDDSRIDSRIVSEALSIQHENFIQSLDKYSNELASLGVFGFETGKPKGINGGRPVRYAMLNEDQFIFAITLSRNTPQVVKAKLMVTKAFAESRKLRQTQEAEYLPAHHELQAAAQKIQKAAEARGSSAPTGAAHMNLNKLNNKLLGISAGSRNSLSPYAKATLGAIGRIESSAINQVLESGGGDKAAYLEWVATMNEAIALASKNKAHPDTIHDLVGISNFLIDGCLDGIDIEAESVALNKAKEVAA